MRTTAVLIAAALGVVLSGTAAQAAPILPCNVLSFECTGDLPEPGEFPEIYNVCTVVDYTAGGLPIKSCQRFRVLDDTPYGDPQTFVYGKERLAPGGYTESTAPAPVAPVVPASGRPAPRPAPMPAPAPVVDAPEAAPVSAVPSPATAEPGQVFGLPRTDASAPDPAGPAAAEVQESSSVRPAYWVAGIAGLVLVAALAWRPRSR